jgi:hypothetical protein
MYAMGQPRSGGGARQRSTGPVDVFGRTFCFDRAGFELDDEFEEAVYEPGVIVLGICACEPNHLAVAVGGLTELAGASIERKIGTEPAGPKPL